MAVGNASGHSVAARHTPFVALQAGESRALDGAIWRLDGKRADSGQ
jgi:hypothetical protein